MPAGDDQTALGCAQRKIAAEEAAIGGPYAGAKAGAVGIETLNRNGSIWGEPRELWSRICNAVWNMSGSHQSTGIQAVALLVVEKDVRIEGLQERGLVQTA
jgi:hypothetical protein